jgi:hypothetical protein
MDLHYAKPKVVVEINIAKLLHIRDSVSIFDNFFVKLTTLYGEYWVYLANSGANNTGKYRMPRSL